MKTYYLYLLFLVFASTIHAQTPGWLFLSGKPHSNLPVNYFDAFATAKKQRLKIIVGDYSDLPVAESYQTMVTAIADTVWGTSRWLNAIAVSATPDQWTALAALPFVKEVWQQDGAFLPAGEEDWPALWPSDSLLLAYQTDRLGGKTWQAAGFSGQGVRVGIVDGGFPGVDRHPAFAHLRDSNRIIATYDFLRNDTAVYQYNRHGTAVLSCIAGRYGDSMLIGLAPDVSVVLARTERGISENIQEELAWINAVEWMDKYGVSLVNSSLGYTSSRYFEEDMDGRTSPIVRAANKAVEKGILIINAAGNEGLDPWYTLGTPADGDSVLAVGATDPYTDFATSFTSVGPAADGRLKPNVSAPGIVVAATPNDMSEVGGTSFSAPLVTGFAACLLQAKPDLGPLALLRAIEQAGHLYPYFDYHHGYGIPIADKALGNFMPDTQAFNFQLSGDYINIKVGQAYIPPRDTADQLLSPAKNLYYHIEKPDGGLLLYKVIAVEEEEPVFIDRSALKSGFILRVHFEGLTKTYTIP